MTVGEGMEDKRKKETASRHRRGNAKRPPPNGRQEKEAIQNLVELVDTGLEEATTEEWSMFMNALKVVQVDRVQDP